VSPPPDGVSDGILVVTSDAVAPAMGCVGLPVSPIVFSVGILVSPTDGVACISPMEAPVSLGTVGEASASELVAASSDRNPIPTKGLIRRGFFGPSGISHSQPEDDGSKGAPVLSSSISKSQLGFSRGRKDKLAQQPPYSEEVLQAMKLAPFMGISVSGKDENKCLALLSAIDKEHKKDAAAVKRVEGAQKLGLLHGLVIVGLGVWLWVFLGFLWFLGVVSGICVGFLDFPLCTRCLLRGALRSFYI
jgi:hypothetical protein